jgi:hypothetical protein
MKKKTNQPTLSQIASTIHTIRKRTVADAVEIGRLLHVAREQAEHGTWGKWIKTEFGWSERATDRYMDLAAFWEKLSPQNRQIAGNRISISALYRLTEYLTGPKGVDDPFVKDILNRAKKAPMTHSLFRELQEQHWKSIRRERKADAAAEQRAEAEEIDTAALEQDDEAVTPDHVAVDKAMCEKLYDMATTDSANVADDDPVCNPLATTDDADLRRVIADSEQLLEHFCAELQKDRVDRKLDYLRWMDELAGSAFEINYYASECAAVVRELHRREAIKQKTNESF